MRHFTLLACLAVTAAASPSAMVDPAQVAADWNKTFEAARQPMLPPGPLGLTNSGPGPLSFRNDPQSPAPFFSGRPTSQLEPTAQASAKPDNREVLVVPGDMDPKILHEVSGNMDPKILHSRSDKKPSALKPLKPIDPRLQPSPDAPVEPAVPENK